MMLSWLTSRTGMMAVGSNFVFLQDGQQFGTQATQLGREAALGDLATRPAGHLILPWRNAQAMPREPNQRGQAAHPSCQEKRGSFKTRLWLWTSWVFEAPNVGGERTRFIPRLCSREGCRGSASDTGKSRRDGITDVWYCLAVPAAGAAHDGCQGRRDINNAGLRA